MTNEFKYEVVEEIAVLSESSKGWTKQLNIVSWNENEPKYDIREWAPDRSKMERVLHSLKKKPECSKWLLRPEKILSDPLNC